MLCSARVVTVVAAALSFSLVASAQKVAPQPVLDMQLRSQPRNLLTKDYPGAGPAIELGLHWLISHQDKDGRWNADGFMAHDGQQKTDGEGSPIYDVAVTGLSLLALAREGKAEGTEPRRLVMLRGASWLSKQQQQKNGLIGGRASHDYVYGHAISTFALCAVAAATGDLATKAAAQQGINYLESHRNPYAVWRYQPRDNDNDTSVTTWATLAYLAGNEIGLTVNKTAFELVKSWLDQVTDEKGRAGYCRRGERSSRNAGEHATHFPPKRGEAMTAGALLCRLSLGQNAESTPLLAKSTALVLETPPTWQPEEGRVDNCYWFFATEALRSAGKPAREQWGTQLVTAVVRGQRVDRAFSGSWDPVGPWGENGGRIYSTAMSVLALQGLYALPEAPDAPAK